MAYDIETTKAPLKFPDSAVDKIMMISYMIDGEGFLITNREIVSKDIEDFEYTPKPEYKGVFTIFNEETEKELLVRFFDHIKEEKPTVIATFNGDFFDWPFVEARAAFHGIDMYQEIGFQKDAEEEYKSTHCVHMDCFRWVKRDSYLPQGSQGLKAVTTAKLGYNPIEVDPEMMTPYAIEQPQVMAEYSVSDAVATYYLYMKYVHPFIFSLCTIIPLNPDEVLRKGTGTLCEMLLMVQAYKNGILLPHKHKDPAERFYDGHLIESETYVGGHVESLEAGVFRSDIPTDFNIDTTAIDELLKDLDSALNFTIEVEAKKKVSDITNYDEVKADVTAALIKLKTDPKRHERPSIYHVDVASMYPNIMTTNRLQPDSMISEEDCASCDFNRPGKTCDRRLPWAWRGEFFPTKKDEYLMIRNSLQNERFPGRFPDSPSRDFKDLSSTEQAAAIKKRITEYSKKVYHKVKVTETIEREAIICQRENPFYVNTVRDFRDRRYEFKGLQKVWKRKVDDIPASDVSGREEAKKMIVLYDSLQLAHKVILNSFYGYVMRKGSRWYSMEMAGVTCLTGATIIQMARSLVERIGRPLELDTDGIWCILPKTFPEDFTFNLTDGKKLPISYPCVMLNHLVHAKFTNHQYQILEDSTTLRYKTISDNSIFFEVDGPYKAMILPTSKEEDKNLKKRYAVFNPDGSLAELKGFEVKRRGELRLIKAFQSQVFSVFLKGTTLTECYAEVGKVANSWLDILDSKGKTLEEDDLIDLISENRSMSKTLQEYEGMKSTSICTARRLAEFLGSQMVKDKGLACKYIISKKPLGAAITDRAVPVAIFSAETSVKSHYLKKWLKDPGLDDYDPRSILDWDYYRERLASTIQKMVTIPAALQQVSNPVSRIQHPDWLLKRISTKNDKLKQKKLSSFFSTGSKPMTDASNKVNQLSGSILNNDRIHDIEDLTLGDARVTTAKIGKVAMKRKGNNSEAQSVALQEQFVSLSLEMPSPEEDYGEWLRYHKKKWAIQKQSRQNRQHLFGDSSRKIGVSGLIMQQTETAYSNSWQFLQFCPSEKGGEARAFVYINDKIQTIRINVGRRLYVNFRRATPSVYELPNCKVEKVNHTLPNGRTSDHLYRLHMSESAYETEMAKADSVLKHANIEGIYESQLGAEDRSLLELGCTTILDNSKPGLLGAGLEKGFSLEWLKPYNEVYLLNSKLNYLFLCHLVSHELQVFALVPSWSSQAFVFVLRPSRSAQGLPNLSKSYEEFLKESNVSMDPGSPIFNYQDQLVFEESYFDDISKLYKKLGQAITKLHSENATKAILCIQSPQAGRLKKLLRPINDFPNIEIRSSTMAIPQIGWQTAAAKRICKSYLSLRSWIGLYCRLSRYSDVPIGNLKGDDIRYLIDVIYARRLQQSNIVLWWSNSPIPDNGGSEKDSILPLIDPVSLPTVNNSGVYSKICIDLQVRNLSVNTILTAAIINEAEGADLAGSIVQGDGSSNSTPFVENAFSTPALAVLSNLVKEWWNQALANDETADDMVNCFISWVSSSNSFLYDQTLYYHVQNLSKKAFIQLVREFRKAGSQLVFADQKRFVLMTPKKILENTYSYANFLIKTIRSKPLFNFLDISLTEYWEVLVWMDDVNFCGKSCKSLSASGKDTVQTFFNWHIGRFLPPLLQTEFEESVLSFMEKYCDYRDQFQKKQQETLGVRQTQISSTALQRVSTDEDNNDSEIDNHFANGIFEAIRPQLVKRVKQLLKIYLDGKSNPDIAVQFEFPVLAGSRLQLSNPITQFVKSLCAVYGLSKELNLESRTLRRNLLSILGIKEFTEEASFKNPSASLIIDSVVCENCYFVCNLDLCRQDDLVRKDTVGNTVYYSWACENCGKDYNRIVLEERLIQNIQKLVTSYQIQDLKCEKCKKIKSDELSVRCECSGNWVETIPSSHVLKSIETYDRVAQFYELKFLQDVTSHLI
ncbi:DNA polymerase epsilon catalytic subunit [Sugiyamaella lignohabitans]|uniref:DNA polymerase epsilon catalytic subunit n=1 Tax=Sugiyamaella lignohabitans TaxID=796027 RepID=A0A167C349_9ASCO|nr:DNA polymerase epsilon catalytic subunit [Sugiyamaella lignohabitans]ANB11162.1 DNA polymerase epsilon catalytic subunit [Sugiyamaella lignohabitans]